MGYKAYGCIIVDTETKTIKAVHTPVVLDLVQDKVRSRVYSVILILLIILSTAYWALGPAFRFAHVANPSLDVAAVTVMLPQSFATVYSGMLLPFPIVSVVSSDGSVLSGRSVTLLAVAVTINQFDELQSIPFLPSLGGQTTVETNAAGLAIFSNISFIGAATIEYNIYFECDSVFSPVVPVSISTNVATIGWTQKPILQLQAKIGEPLNDVVMVDVIDIFGNPLPNKVVTVSISQFPNVLKIFPNYGIVFGNEVVSNEYGTATFSNITFMGSNSLSISLSFYCEGIFLNGVYSDYSIILQTQVSSVIISQPPPTSVVEGSLLGPSIVTIYDALGNTLSGKYVIAMITVEDGFSAMPTKFSYKKVLKNSVEISQSNGSAIFSLFFTAGGFSGNYSVVFYCDGIQSLPVNVFVQTTVAKVQFLSNFPTTMELGNGEPVPQIAHIVLTPQVLDKNNNPVPNKVVTLIVLYAWGNGTFQSGFTDSQGIATIWLNTLTMVDVFNSGSPNSTFDLFYVNYSLLAQCDGIDSSVVTFSLYGSSSPDDDNTQRNIEDNTILTPWYIEVIIPPSGVYYIVGNNLNGIQPLVRLVDYRGFPITTNNSKDSPSQIFPCVFYNDGYHYTTYQIYKDYDTMSSYNLTGLGYTDINGYVQFGNNGSDSIFGVSAGYTGTVLIGFCEKEYGFLSDIYPVQVISPIESVVLGRPNRYYNSYNYEINPYQPLGLTVDVTCTRCDLLSGVYPTIYVQSGPNLSSNTIQHLFYGNNGTQITNTLINPFWSGFSSNISCSFNGSFSISCTFGDLYVKGPVMNFVIVVEFGGVQSNHINLAVGSAVGVIVPIPSESTDFTAVLQQPSIINANVIIQQNNGTAVSGIIVFIIACQDPTIKIINPQNGCNDCGYSSISDENGIAFFDSIQFYSGASGTYQICFSTGLTRDESFVVSIPWNIEIQLINPILSSDIRLTNTIIAPGITQLKAEVYFTSSSVLILDLNIIASEGLVLPPESTYPCYGTDIACERDYTVAAGDGYYWLYFNLLGIISDNYTVLVDSVPTMIVIYSSGDIATYLNVDFLAAETLVIQAFNTNGNYLYGTNFTVQVNSNSSTNTAVLATKTCGSSDQACIYNLIFTAGVSGLYEVVFSSGPAVGSIQVNLTNPISQVYVANADKITFTNYGKPMPVQPIISVTMSNGKTLVGRSVTAAVVNAQGRALVYKKTPILDEHGNAAFLDLTVLIQTPGNYSLQFFVGGIASAPLPFSLENAAFPSYANLDLHHTQEKIVLGALLVVPLFIGNSVRQPAWQLALSVPALAVILYMAYTNLAAELRSRQRLMQMGIAYYLLDVTLRVNLAICVVGFFIVVFLVVYGHMKGKTTTFYDEKIQSCRNYLRFELLSYGMKRYQDQQSSLSLIGDTSETITDKPHVNFLKAKIQDLKSAILSYVKKPKKKRYTAFYYPMRLLIGFGASVLCAFLTACACSLGISIILVYLDNVEVKITSLLAIAQQLLDFTSTGANDNIFSNDKLIALSEVIGISTQQLQSMLTNIQQGSSEGIDYLIEATTLIEICKKTFKRSALIALSVSIVAVFGTWLSVFRKYKERIFYLRQGKSDLISYNMTHFTIEGASTYVGLQAIHTSFGFFMTWVSLVIILMLVQVHAFWAWVWSYFPLLTAFLLGVPFISKTITKLFVFRWIMVHDMIVHFRIWSIFDFMWIFVNLLSSIVLTALRIVFAIAASMIYAIRMDAPLVSEQYDYFDFGFKAYVGMLLMDHIHNNPVLLLFTDMLIHDMKETRKERKSVILKNVKERWTSQMKEESLPLILPVVEETDIHIRDKKRTRIISKWWLLVTLHNNPSLRSQRKTVLANCAK